MHVLDTTSREIILLLLSSPTPASSREIGLELGITPRQLRYRIDSIRKWLNNREAELILKPKVGIWVESSADQISKIIKEIESLTGYRLVLSAGERAQM